MNARLDRPLGPLIIRADASTQIGSGHVMRCLALAQVWQDAGGGAVFVMAMEAPALEYRFRLEGIEVVHLSSQPGGTDDAIQTVDLGRQRQASWVVVDGYHFGAVYQRIIKDCGLRLLIVDDNGHADHYYADIVLDQNIHAHEGLYRNRESYTRLLLGTRYALLRREFLEWRGWRREIAQVARGVLITLGGGDPNNVTLKVIRALQQVEVEGLEAVAVVGGINPHYRELQSAVADSRVPIRLERDATNMPGLMAWADVAASAGGSTSWELAFMGLPTLLLILADNQRPIAERLDAAMVAVNLGWYEDLASADIAQRMTQLLVAAGKRGDIARRGRELVDGEGAARVLTAVEGKALRLRKAREDDCTLLWEWANDPAVRAAAFRSEPITWEEHMQWLAHKLRDPNCYIFIAVDTQDRPIGQVRFDAWNNEQAEIDVSIDKGNRRSGRSNILIRMAVNELFRLTSIRIVHAFIRPENEASIRAFGGAQFSRLGMETLDGTAALHYVRIKSNEQ